MAWKTGAMGLSMFFLKKKNQITNVIENSEILITHI